MLRHAGLALLAPMFLASPCPAQDDAADGRGWRFLFAPYLWMTSIDGDVSARGRTADVDVDFGDIWEDLDFGAQVHLEAWRGRWGAFVDPTYLYLSDDPLGVDVDTRLWLVEFGGMYRLLENRALGGTLRGLSLDVLAGGRYWNGRITIDPPNLSAVESSHDWADPIIGSRLQGDLPANLFFSLGGNIGGFGLASDLTWSATGLLGYRFTPLFSLLGGYRALGVDYEQGGFRLDTTMHGPVVGAAFSF
ncbi:hypothetical protein V6C53_03565 [Desulfocurvibacter africanus]|uniref:hypothetical protein n=1 Tax=Desulfocurvibacter africanus TaxID=873 RepID=UPI002FDA730F